MLSSLLNRALALSAGLAVVIASAAQASLVITPGPTDTTIAFEAELGTIDNSYGDPTKGWVVDGVTSPATGASGGSYVVATEHTTSSPPHNTLTFNIKFAKTGTYTLWHRNAYTTQDFDDTRNSASNNDSFFYEDGTLGDATKTYETLNSYTTSTSAWEFDSAPSNDITIGSTGITSWIVGNREDGSMLDRFVLVHEDEPATVNETFLEALANTTVVPEPTTLLIWSLLAGLGVGLGWRRRK